MSVIQSPTVRRRRLGIELRKLREGAGLLIEQVATELECSGSHLSRIETGKAVARIRDVRDMLDLYKVENQRHRELLLTMARQAQQKGWWNDFEDVLPAGFDIYVGLEAEAASLRAYDTQLITGLLQTGDYARALFRATRPTSEDQEIERLVELRLRRQEVLARKPPFELWAMLDDAVLRRSIGGLGVMRAQLRRVVEAAALPNVTVQVLPFSQGAHPGLDGAFSILEFKEPVDQDVACVDTPAGTIYVEKPDRVRRYTLSFDHLRAAALPPDESLAYIDKVATLELM